jgi:hypothetical protein
MDVRLKNSKSYAQRSTPNPVKGRGPNGALRPRSSIELHIEEMVLHGFESRDRYAIGEAVERELALLLGEQAIPNSLRVDNATDEIKGATFNILPTAKPPAIGRQIAQAVYQAFGQ